MKDLNDLGTMSREDLISLVRQFKLQNEELERERYIVGESLIRANRLAEVIQNKAEEQAKEIRAAAEKEYKNLLGNVAAEKDALLIDIKKLRSVRSTMVEEMNKIAEKYSVLFAEERENIAQAEKREEASMQATPVAETPAVKEELAHIVTFPEPVVAVEEPSQDNSSLVSLLVEPEAPAVQEAPVEMFIPEPVVTPDLSSLLAAVQATSAPEVANVNTGLESFVAELQKPAEAPEQVDLNSLLNNISEAPAAAIPAPVFPEAHTTPEESVNINDLLASVQTSNSAPAQQPTAQPETVDLNTLLNSVSTKETTPVLDVSDLLG